MPKQRVLSVEDLHRRLISRRVLLAQAAALATIPALDSWVVGAPRRRAKFAVDPFRLGIASGDPSSDGVVLWTRLAPDPLVPGGGLTPEIIEVDWEVASDESMKHVVQRGRVLATPQLAHSVHVEIRGLQPDRWYWYRFRAGDAESGTGRTRTLPSPSAAPERLRFLPTVRTGPLYRV